MLYTCCVNIQSCTVTIMCIGRELIHVYTKFTVFTFPSSAKAHWVTHALSTAGENQLSSLTICHFSEHVYKRSNWQGW